jgi:hypothetical protein
MVGELKEKGMCNQRREMRVRGQGIYILVRHDGGFEQDTRMKMTKRDAEKP